jgi:sugar lactone lactonase YvrE
MLELIRNAERMRGIKEARSTPLFIAALVSCLLATDALAQSDGDGQPLFFPMPPNEPRLQFLEKYSSSLDVSTRRSGFRDFVFGGEDKEAQLVQKPYGLAVHDGAIYVVDTRGNGYGIFDIEKKRSRFIRPTGAGALVKPINITIDDDGTRFVTDTDRGQVLVFDAEDRFQRTIGKPGQFKPVDVALAGDRLYITDIMNHQVWVLDKKTGDTLATFGEAGSEPGQLFHPTNLTVASDGTVYVSDTSNFRLQQFDEDGNFIREIGSIGNRPGTFSRPKGIDVDREGRIYVTDAAFENIQVLGPDGGALMAFGKPGDEPADINMPAAIKVDYENVGFFQKFAAPNFDIEYLVVVASQFGLNKVVVFGYGDFRE